MIAKSIKIHKGVCIKNPKGNIIKFLNKNEKYFKKFGEIYFSEIKLKKIKGWNYHQKNTCILMVPFGKVKFVVFDYFQKKRKEVILSDKNNLILQIPPRLWFSFTSLVKKSIVVNIMDNIHKKDETKKRKEINNLSIK